jgi:thermitase
MTTQESTPRWPLRDHRSADQIARDGVAAARQVDVLRGDEPSQTTASRAEARILRRQAQAPAGTRYVASPTQNTAGPVLVAENQLVIKADDHQLASLSSGVLAGYEVQRREGCGTHVLRGRGKSLETLQSDIARLRAQNIPANINLVMPLGYVVKADAYPGITAGPGNFAPAEIDQTVRVAIIDTGRTAEERDDAWFTGVQKTGTDPLNVLPPMDRNDWFAGHGTFTAGIVRQIAPTCEILVYRFTGPDGLGTDDAAADTFRKAADDAAQDGRRLIINASFGAPAVNGVQPLALQEAVEYISSQYPDVLIVASAGNDGTDERLYPAAFTGVKAVGALNSDLSPAEFSNRGGWVECSTVGVGVVSTYVKGKLPPEPNIGADIDFPGDAWATWSGTSFTAPQISAAVAQLCAETPGLDPRAAFDQLLTGRPQLGEFGAVVHLLPGTPTA